MPEEINLAAPAVVDLENESLEEVPVIPEPEKPVDPDAPAPQEEKPKSHYDEEFERIENERKALEERHKSELEAANAEKKRLMMIKDKALMEEKEKTKSVKESWKQEALSEMDRRLEIRDARSRAAKLTNDPVAHKVIMHHYENLPDSLRSRSLDPDIAVEENLQTALALANRKRLASVLAEESMTDAQNQRSIASMSGSNLPGRSSFQGTPSNTARAAIKLVSAYAGKDKNLSKKLSDRLNKRYS